MKAGQPKPADELRMSSKEFDRIMGRALQVEAPGTETEAGDKDGAQEAQRQQVTDSASQRGPWVMSLPQAQRFFRL